MRTATVWHPVLEGFQLELIHTGEGSNLRTTIVVLRDRTLVEPIAAASIRAGAEWVEIGRLTVSAYDADAVLCFADTTVTLLTLDGEPLEHGPDGRECWGASIGQVISENGELGFVVMRDTGDDITYRLELGGARK